MCSCFRFVQSEHLRSCNSPTVYMKSEHKYRVLNEVITKHRCLTKLASMKFVALSFFVVVYFSAYVGSQTMATKPAVTTTKTTPRLTTKTTTKTTTMPKTTIPTNTNSYCNIDTCPVPSEHILCASNTSWGAACGMPNTTKSSISAEDIEIIVSLHNQFRRIIAKGEVPYGETGSRLSASNMRRLVWDEELAIIAQTHAQQCVYDYDACRDVSRFPVGQNSFIFHNVTIHFIPPIPSIYSWALIILSWFLEFQNMLATYVLSFPANPPDVIGLFTQLAWATTYTVGCGVAHSNLLNNSDAPIFLHYVCNYGPAGNVINSSVYSVGTPGSACPAPTSNVDGLCA